MANMAANKLEGKADLHIHSGAGDGVATVDQILEYVEHQTDLDLIAVTDHDLIDGALEARELGAKRRYRFDTIVGMEITTLEGHLLAYDLEEPIRMLLPLVSTIRSVHEQGGFCVVPHPMSWLTRSIGLHGLRRVIEDERDGVSFDGVEVLNPTLAGRVIYEKVLALNRESWLLPELGGSDAHSLEFIGSGHTLFPGRRADDFRRALKEKTTRACGRFLDLEDHRRLLNIAGEQMLKSLLIMPSQHVKRAIESVRKEQRQ
jgi:predicted metal-dependent phosphoesterase TrpH